MSHAIEWSHICAKRGDKKRRERESNKATRKKTREMEESERKGEGRRIDETEEKKGSRKDGSITRDGFVRNSKKAN